VQSMASGGHHSRNSPLYVQRDHHSDATDLPQPIWLPSTAGHCRTCNGPSSCRLVEESILATYRCPVGHTFYEVAP